MKKETIKEKLNNYRLWSTFVITIDTACIAWFISNYSKVFPIIVYYDIFAIILLTALFIFLCSKTIDITNDLED